MRFLAGLFSFLTLAVLLAAAWFALRPPPMPRPEALTGPVTRIVVEKAARRMTVYVGDKAARVWPIALGFTPTGAKDRQGDGRTPEGRFRIDRRNAASAYHLSLGIDYPRPEDRQRARMAGVSPGGDIFFHGQPNGRPEGEVLAYDWTAGCIALSDAQIAELFAATPIGAEVEIRP
ncbi:L,D-transpeptidase family protein [Paenirhodobacter sp.]|uniref:L,D-transpeptidase family protein n=1 Tax=Paenirhodobacter sp. TaxID=1965326 RepID=UPI003B3F40E7